MSSDSANLQSRARGGRCSLVRVPRQFAQAAYTIWSPIVGCALNKFASRPLSRAR